MKPTMAVLLVIYVFGFGTAFYTAVETWGPSRWYSYPALIPFAAAWPLFVTLHAVACVYEGSGKVKSEVCHPSSAT